MTKPKPKKLKMPKEFSDKPKGLVICYIGAGKGKTTAAMGMAVRASGDGKNVFILQFVKAGNKTDEKVKEGEWPISSEINFFDFLDRKLGSSWGTENTLSFSAGGGSAFGGNSFVRGGGSTKIGRIDNEQVGLGFVGILGDKKEKDIHIRAALKGVERAREIITSGKYELVILDEIISALEVGILEERDILDLIKIKPELMHLVITGHNHFPKILKQCDLVTEMKMIQHPYYKGILAQKGIDY